VADEPLERELVGAKVLIVDDNPLNIAVLKDLLAFRGISADTLSDPTQVMASLSNNYDLILLDIIMPGISGDELLQEIRREHSPIDLPVIMVTALGDMPTFKRCFKLGANDYITKPVDLDAAWARIKAHLSIKRLFEASKGAYAERLRVSQLKTLSEMSGYVGHHFNNILTALTLGQASLARYLSESGAPERVMTQAERMGKSLDRLADIVESVMIFGGHRDENCGGEANFGTVVDETVEIFMQKFEPAHITVKWEKPADPVMISCIPTELRIVVFNLLKNAVTAVSSVENPWIGLSFATGENTVRLLVEDNGEALPADIEEKVFQPFFTTSQDLRTVGMGLPVARAIVEGCRGRLFLERAPGSKAFVVELPKA